MNRELITLREKNLKLSSSLLSQESNDRLLNNLNNALERFRFLENSTSNNHTLTVDSFSNSNRENLSSSTNMTSSSSIIRPISLFPPEGKKWVISFGLYGTREKYLGGAVDNARLAKEIFPDWTVRFYVGSDVPRDAVDRLRDLDAEIIDMKQTSHATGNDDGHVSGDTAGMFWRFLPEDDPTVDRFICRDSDSRLSWRERAAVYEWIASGKSLHVMRDHKGHGQSMPGGMWGAIRGAITQAAGKSFRDIVLEWSGSRDKFYADMNFLNDEIYPLMKNDYISHDAFFCTKFDAISFPIQRKDRNDFVGQVHMGEGKGPIYHIDMDAPSECRRHPSWILG